MDLAQTFRRVASTLATASVFAEAFGESSIVPTSHSCHEFHISWLCIVGAIKNVKTWVVGAQVGRTNF